MGSENQIKIFKDQKIRSKWDKDVEEWFFSIIDVVGVLSQSTTPKRYWSDLKKKLKDESGKPYENIVRLKMPAADGKMRLTDVTNTEQILRIIQSIPSPNAEPFKRWLAKVGK